jgi:hypothetical protein
MSKFPADFPEVAHKIFTRIFRVYAIIYHSHFDVSALVSRLLFRALTSARSPRSSLPLTLARSSSSRRARRLTLTRHSSTSSTLRTRTACSRRRSTRRSKSPWSACCSSTTRPSDRDLTRRWRGAAAALLPDAPVKIVAIEQFFRLSSRYSAASTYAARRRRRRRRRCGVASASSRPEPARAGPSRPDHGLWPRSAGAAARRAPSRGRDTKCSTLLLARLRVSRSHAHPELARAPSDAERKKERKQGQRPQCARAALR